jgi:hypothetical protein
MLWLRRTNQQLKKPTLKWARELCTVQHIDDCIPRHHHLFPKRQKREWYFRTWTRGTNGAQTMLRITRVPKLIEDGEEAMSFDEAYCLFMGHARMLVSQPTKKES